MASLSQIEQMLGGDPFVLMVQLQLLIARIGAALWITPFFGGQVVPKTVRVALAVAIAILLYPHLAPQLAELRGTAGGTVNLYLILVKEVAIGFAMGYVASLLFWAFEAAGRLGDLARGASMGEILVPQTGAKSSPLGALYQQLSVVIFLSLGGHYLFLDAIATSYVRLPIMAVPKVAGLANMAELCMRLSADMLLIAVTIAAPITATLFLTDAILGIINRFASQINAYFLAMPAKAVGGIAVVALCTTALLTLIPELLERGMLAVVRAVYALSG